MTGDNQTLYVLRDSQGRFYSEQSRGFLRFYTREYADKMPLQQAQQYADILTKATREAWRIEGAET